ncbi:MAG: molybdopterin oxidoreductase family protein [Acidobacteria bacterium]|nr:molybdopterin oxidoreductase family protein [Acidobacteriota bacterium]
MSAAPEETTVVRAACPHDCPDTCSMLVEVVNGRAVRVKGDPDHPMTQGFLCSKVNRYPERTYHRDRLHHPMVRTGGKGDGKFRQVSWDEALGLVADRLDRIIHSDDGPQAILPYSYAGTMGLLQSQSMDRRFFHIIGASLLDRTICATAGTEALNATYGTRMGTDPETIDQAKLILLWGTNTLTSNPHLWPWVRAARDAGARVITIDPIRTRTADASDEHIQIRPGTDAALALAMMHVIFRDGLADFDYLERTTLGWESLRERAIAEYSPERVAGICRIDSREIERLANLYATTRPSFIRLNYGMQRHAGGGNAVRAISILPAVTGAWNDIGGGFQLSSSGTFHFDETALERPDLIPPGTRTINMSTIGDDLLGRPDPPIRAIVVYNSNPVAVAPDQSSVRKGFARDDLFVVVLEHFMTDTARYADVVLPATTQLEHTDLHKSYGHLYVNYSAQSIAPIGEALPNTEIFRRLAATMNLDHPALQDSDEELMRQALGSGHPTLEGITLEKLKESGSLRLNLPAPHLPFPAGTVVPTRSGKIEIRSSMLEALGLDPLPSWVPPHESEESAPELAARYPLTLISPPAHTFLNSTFANVEPLKKLAGRPTLQINARDAADRGIEHGMKVTVRNDRGTFMAEAEITDRVRPGVVSAPSIWWLESTEGSANANATTSQKLTDIGRAATFYDNLVEVTHAETIQES